MEHSIGSIITKLDAVLVRIGVMQEGTTLSNCFNIIHFLHRTHYWGWCGQCYIHVGCYWTRWSWGLCSWWWDWWQCYICVDNMFLWYDWELFIFSTIDLIYYLFWWNMEINLRLKCHNSICSSSGDFKIIFNSSTWHTNCSNKLSTFVPYENEF